MSANEDLRNAFIKKLKEKATIVPGFHRFPQQKLSQPPTSLLFFLTEMRPFPAE
jgi:hypothetical protein